MHVNTPELVPAGVLHGLVESIRDQVGQLLVRVCLRMLQAVGNDGLVLPRPGLALVGEDDCARFGDPESELSSHLLGIVIVRNLWNHPGGELATPDRIYPAEVVLDVHSEQVGIRQDKLLFQDRFDLAGLNS